MNEQNEENPGRGPEAGGDAPQREEGASSAPKDPKDLPRESDLKEAQRREAEEKRAAEADYDASGLDPNPSAPGTKSPLYGQMLSDYPGYNPYIFGGPDSPSAQTSKDGGARQGGGENPFSDSYGASGHPEAGFQNPQSGRQPGDPGQNPYFGQQPPQNPYFGQPFGGRRGDGFYGYGPSQNLYEGQRENANPSDPGQNPYFGKMDGFAVISFIASVVGIWIVGLPMGIFSLLRIKQLHTRGKGLAIAAIAISCLYIVLDVILFLFGITDQQIVNWIAQKMGSGGGSLRI